MKENTQSTCTSAPMAPPCTPQLPRALELRMMHDHEGLGGQQPRPVPRRDDGVEIGGLQPHRFFDEHMLARLQRLQRPFAMQVVRQAAT